MAEQVIGPESYIEGSYLSDFQIPGHLPVGTHPFRMTGGTFDFHMSMSTVLRQETVIGLHTERNTPIDFDPVPTPEPVQLRRPFAPGTDLDHQIRRSLRLSRNLPEDWLIPA